MKLIINKEPLPSIPANKSGQVSQPSSADCFSFESTKARRVNAVLSLYDDEDVKADLASIPEGLDAGRTVKGIKSLATDWARTDCDPDDCKTKDKIFIGLRYALIQFAQKVLFLANHDVLEDDRSDINSANRAKIQNYILVLQAIGNSILTEADDQLRYEKYQKNIRDTVKRLQPALTAEAHAAADRAVLPKPAGVDPSVRKKTTDTSPSDTSPASSTIPAFNLAAVGSKDDNDSKTTGRDVLDKLIAALRFEYAFAVREGGTTSVRASNLAEALKVALDQRGGFARLRPAVAYLRSSYAVSELQSDPGLTWKNELTPSLTKSIPFVGGALFNYDSQDGGSGQKAKIVAALDKQNWQNINSVRVSGGGRTNYAIAKDDVGNWYVKAYASDPQDIIKSAKALALFGLSGGGNSLLKYSSNPAANVGQPASNTPGDPTAPTSRLDKAFMDKQQAYQDETGQEQANLLLVFDPDKGLAAQLKNAISAEQVIQSYETLDANFHPDPIIDAASTGTLAVASKRWNAIVGDTDKTKAKLPKVQGNWIIQSLQEVRAFARQCENRLGNAVNVAGFQKQVTIDEQAVNLAKMTLATANGGQDAQAKKDAADALDKATTTLNAHMSDLATAKAARQAIRQIAVDQSDSLLRSTISERRGSVRKFLQTVDVLTQVNNAK